MIHPEFHTEHKERLISLDKKPADSNDHGIISTFRAHARFNGIADGAGTAIAILDTGVGPHSDLNAKTVFRGDVTDNVVDINDLDGHGTHIAGIIASDTYDGIAPATKILSIKITTRRSESTTLVSIADGLEIVLNKASDPDEKNKPTAAIICFNTFENVFDYTLTQHHRLSRLVKGLYDMRIPVICSSGNNYDIFKKEGLAYPAYIQHIIAVSATYNNSSELTPFAQRFPIAERLFNNYYLQAPGYQTLSCGIEPENGSSILSGSSQAAAIIAGTILLWQSHALKEGLEPYDIDTLVKNIKTHV